MLIIQEALYSSSVSNYPIFTSPSKPYAPMEPGAGRPPELSRGCVVLPPVVAAEPVRRHRLQPLAAHHHIGIIVVAVMLVVDVVVVLL